MEAEESVSEAVATAGSAVVFAGLTVMIALVRTGRGRHPLPHHHGRRGRGRGRHRRADRARPCCPPCSASPASGCGRSRGRTERRRRLPPARSRKPKQPRTPLPRLWVRAVTKVAAAHHAARGGRAGRAGLPGQGPADRPAQQRHGRAGHAGAGDVRPDRRALRGGLQRTADRQRHHRRLRRPARGDGRDRRRAAGPAGRGQRAAVDAQRERRGRHRPGDPDRSAGLGRDQGPGAADPLDAGPLPGRVRRTGLRHRLHRRRHRRLRPARQGAAAVRRPGRRLVARCC